MREIKSLTSLRGIFAMWVLLFHLGVWAPAPGWQPLPIFDRGYLAVDFFLMLSGFILARRHGAEFHSGCYLSAYRKFVIKRIWRLFPLHWAVLVANIFGLLIFKDSLPWRGYILGEAALIHRWNLFPASMSAINGPDWSISTEWAANLMFPAYVILGMRRRALASAFGVICAVGITFVAWDNRWSMDAARARSWLPLIRCGAEFGIGVLLARSSAPTWLARDWVISLLALWLILAVIFKIDLLAVGLLALIMLPLTHDRGNIARALSVAPLHWLGKISYSIYLIQVPTMILVRKLARHYLAAEIPIYVIGSVAGVVAISWVSYNLIEDRGVRLLRRTLTPQVT